MNVDTQALSVEIPAAQRIAIHRSPVPPPLANPAAATAGAPTPFNFETVWTQSRWGRWMLNGRDTNVRSHP